MRLLLPLSAAALALAVASVASATPADAHTTAPELRLNGWFACGRSGSATYSNAQPKSFKCAEVGVPLCHKGVCESNRTISLFVKRLPANATNEIETSKSLWMLQGGPGGSSVNMESAMLKIHRQLEYKVNLYTVDHRGTGRSFFLQCDAAQAFTSGSPSGIGLSADEVPDCLRDLLFQIDNQTAAFSVTSAATDVAFLVQKLHAKDEEVYVYGASYGTYLTERVMHLAPSNVNGYILDGVVAEDTAAKAFTARNSDNVTPTKRLAKLCEETQHCAAMFGKFKKGELYAKWLEIYDELDALKKGDNKCADFFRSTRVGNKPTRVSSAIKSTLGPYANVLGGRAILPALLKLIHRCKDKNDLLAIQNIDKIIEMEINVITATPDPLSGSHSVGVAAAREPVVRQAVDVISESSRILGFLIKASELWPSPSPLWANETEVFEGTVFPQPLSSDYTFHCLFKSDFSDPFCNTSEGSHNKQPAAFTYKTDQYYETFATIPDHASVLVINGKLDFQTMSDHGVREYENLEGGRGKMMVEMDYGGHCSGIQRTTVQDKTQCGYRIIASFVEHSGDVETVDTSCVEELKPLMLLSADMIVQAFVARKEATRAS